MCWMVPEEDSTTDGGGDDGGTIPPEDGPQLGQEDQGTGIPEETGMHLDQQEGPGTEEHSGTAQEPSIGLPLLETQRRLDILATVAHMSLIAQALGGIPSRRKGPQAGQGDGSQRIGQQEDRQDDEDRQESRQEGLGQLAPQKEPGQRSESQDFIPLSFAKMQGDEDHEAGEIPLTREQMRRAGMLLQERVAEEQRLQKATPARRHTAITKELSTERQAR